MKENLHSPCLQPECGTHRDSGDSRGPRTKSALTLRPGVSAPAGRALGPLWLNTRPPSPWAGCSVWRGVSFEPPGPTLWSTQGPRTTDTLKGAPQETGRRLCAHGRADHWPLPSPASKPRARRQLDSAFPRMNRETKKEEKGQWPGMVGHAGAPRPSWLSCPSGALHIQGCPCGLGGPVCSRLLGFLFLSGLPWTLSPGVSVSGRVQQGERGAAVLEKTPAMSLLWRACPGTGGSLEF